MKLFLRERLFFVVPSFLLHRCTAHGQSLALILGSDLGKIKDEVLDIAFSILYCY
jgi:hypothetical protein